MSAQWPVGSRCNTPCATKNFCAVHWAKMHIPFRLKIIMGVNQVIKALFFTCFQRERDEGSFYVDIVEVTSYLLLFAIDSGKQLKISLF